ncbi:MAG TPA: hypothetical protein VHO48_13770 [Anaerolineaceae bacterium]|nr:hypothetical protein [Anaerolineaceae bacterium]
MDNPQVYFICPTCYRVCASRQECHEHLMLPCSPGQPGSLRRKPVTDSRGVLQSRAPRWFLEATGWIQARGRYSPYPRNPRVR